MSDSTPASSGSEQGSFRVLVAGGGIAALEGALTLRELCRHRLDLTLLAPDARFSYRALSVAAPFGLGSTTELELADFARDVGATLHRGTLASVEMDVPRVTTGAGERIGFDAILIATGTRPVNTLPGSMTFSGGRRDVDSFARLLRDLESGAVVRLAFAIPATVSWPVPLYDLALLTAAHLREAGVDTRELSLVTPEPEPLSMFGPEASENVRNLLDQAGVTVLTNSAPTAIHESRLGLASGASVEVDAVVSLPALEVPPIPGVPQGPNGFVNTDREMRVAGLERLYAAGDITSFPIKQGGVAAQQADTAASSLASAIDPAVSTEPFRPVLRGALLNGRAPLFLRARPGDPAASEAGIAHLWWPPSKVAGRRLAPYLAGRRSAGPAEPPLEDLEPLQGEDRSAAADDHRDAVDLALTAADADAHWGDYRAALRWLDVAEELEIVLPERYAEKRKLWSRLARGGARRPGEPAGA